MDFGQLTAPLIALLIALILTPAARYFAHRSGLVAEPRPDRWHTVPTAMLGGVPIFAAFILAIVLSRISHAPAWGILLGSAFMFLFGLVDDLKRLPPFAKLVGTICASGIVLYSGLCLPWFVSMPVNAAVTILWLVGITNAMNLLDGLNGLASGIALIASLFLALSFFIEGKVPERGIL